MKFLLALLIGWSICFISQAQQLTAQFGPTPFHLDWQRAGFPGDTVPSYPNIVDVTAFGADNTGATSTNAVVAAAIASLAGANGVIYFPAGNYLFTNAINLRSGLILRGAGSGNTTLTFNLGAASADLIVVQGTAGASTAATAAVQQYGNQVTVTDPSIVSMGNFAKIYQDNETALISDTWADNTVGQISCLKSKSGNTLTFFGRHRRGITLAGSPRVQALNMVKGVGVECLKIKRLDSDPTANQTSNILFRYAAFCWVKGIDSDSANYAHVVIINSSNIEVTGNYFHGAFSYGGGGEGYGVVCQLSTSDCLIENNIFRNLRHAMLLQAGVNGNVYSYNYSFQQTRSEFPSDAAGDIVLHGNYPYANLFEGNIAQNVGGDASHGINGPANVFFRNRAMHYGIAFSGGSGDSSIVIYNEVTGTGTSPVFPVLALGGFSTNGANTIASRNYRQNSGGFIGNMESSFTPNEASTYVHFLQQTRPYFYPADLQPMGYPATFNNPFVSIPARDRFLSGGVVTYCSNLSRKDSLMPVTCTPLAPSSNGGYDVHDINETAEFRDNSNCGLIATIIPSGSNPVSGVIRSRVSIDASVQSFDGKAYVRRHYDIEPILNPATSTATLTLYFTQQDFDTYNTANGTEPDLPGNPADAAGKANLVVMQFHGTGTAPGNYSGALALIDPDDGNIVWNAASSQWEITFEVSGFSGFYVRGGSASLPVRLVSFKYSLPDQQQVLLSWEVAEQQDIRKYVVERSSDGRSFSAIGSIQANDEISYVYQFSDNNSLPGLNYYRLRIEEDNRTSYSKILIVSLSEGKVALKVFPMPVSNEFKIRLLNYDLINTEAQLHDSNGKLIQRIRLTGALQTVHLNHLPAGVYYLRTANGKAYRILKQ